MIFFVKKKMRVLKNYDAGGARVFFIGSLCPAPHLCSAEEAGSPALKWKRPFPFPSSLWQAARQAPQFTQETSLLFFLGVTFIKQTLSQPLQLVHSSARAVSIFSRREIGLIQPKSICIRPAAQTNLQRLCRIKMDVVSI